MERFWTIAGIVFFVFFVDLANSQNITYCSVGGSIVLRPPPGTDITTITGIQWRHQDNIVAEWSEGDAAVDTYNNFEKRATLDIKTGLLTLSDMSRGEAGVYTVVMNNMHLQEKYVVAVLKKVPKPEVWPKPKAEGENDLDCLATVEKEAEPVTYFWKTDEDGAWRQLDKKIVIKDNETTRLIKTYSCKIQNPVSESASEPRENPFYPKPSGSSGLEALAILPILAVLALIGVGIWKKEELKTRFCAGQQGNKKRVNSTEENPLNTVENGGQPPNPSE